MYTYLIGSLIYLGIWILIYVLRRDLQKNMIKISIPFSFIGLLMSAFFYTKDWWHPKTILGTPFGIEDMIFGFSMAGIGYSIYPFIMKEKETSCKADYKKLILISTIMILLGLVPFLLSVNSSIAGLIPTIIYIIIVLTNERRIYLIKKSLLSSVFLTISAMIIYPVLSYIDPGFLNTTFYFNNLSNIVILKAPLEDLLWFFYSGIFLSTICNIVNSQENSRY